MESTLRVASDHAKTECRNWSYPLFPSGRCRRYPQIAAALCPACQRVVIELRRQDLYGNNEPTLLIWPKAIARAPLPVEVPKEFATDCREACLVLSDSPKASAALSRRCLQHLLREKAGIKKSDLSNEAKNSVKCGVGFLSLTA